LIREHRIRMKMERKARLPPHSSKETLKIRKKEIGDVSLTLPPRQRLAP
jgi:hypothetical protein